MENGTFIIVGIILLLMMAVAILVFVILQLREKNQSDIATVRATCENEIRKLDARHAEELKAIKQECAEQIKRTKEGIESRREVLVKMNEKELLINIMIALDGYGNRFDRVEQYLTDDRITCLINDITEKINSITGVLEEQMEDMRSSVQRCISDSDLKKEMDSISSDLEDLSSDINEIKSNVYNNYYYGNDTDIEDVKNDINSLRFVIEETKEATENARYAAESARYAAESAKDAIESHF